MAETEYTKREKTEQVWLITKLSFVGRLLQIYLKAFTQLDGNKKGEGMSDK